VDKARVTSLVKDVRVVPNPSGVPSSVIVEVAISGLTFPMGVSEAEDFYRRLGAAIAEAKRQCVQS
jgi:hypothetical protein